MQINTQYRLLNFEMYGNHVVSVHMRQFFKPVVRVWDVK